jgi:hypothetical protein
MPYPHQIGACIFTRPYQITHRLNLTLGHPHFGDLA